MSVLGTFKLGLRRFRTKDLRRIPLLIEDQSDSERRRSSLQNVGDAMFSWLQGLEDDWRFKSMSRRERSLRSWASDNRLGDD